MEMTVLADFWLIFAKIAKSAKVITPTSDRGLVTDLYTKLPEKSKKVGPKA